MPFLNPEKVFTAEDGKICAIEFHRTEQDDDGNTPVEILSSRNNPELGDLCIDLMIAIRQIEGTIEEKEEGPAHDIWSDMDYMNDDVEESSNNSGADTD